VQPVTANTAYTQNSHKEGMVIISASPMFWNSLPRHLHDPSHTDAVFGRLLFLFSEYYCTQCTRGNCDDELYKFMFYLLTYLLISHWYRRLEITCLQKFMTVIGLLQFPCFVVT